ncbi:MAG: hypothetical protein HFG50_16460 [Lachnospiraceae bacterium]|nr:hypothetical protein [Lachnospiraceae bacterium]
MKRFDYFGDYMFDLLFAPLKKGKQTINQFYIFFKVIGQEFDDIKEAFFQVRDEANVISASPVMLPVYGQDRDMPRLPEEDTESYRTRLSMKALIARKAGTREGILLGLAALGYRNCDIEPLVYKDPARWAEFLVRIKSSLDDSMPVSSMIKKVVQELKPGSAKANYEFDFFTTQKVKIVYSNQICFTMAFYPLFNLPKLRLNRTWKLDGSKKLNGFDGSGRIDLYPVGMEFQVPVREEVKEAARLTIFTKAAEQVASSQDVEIRTSATCQGEVKEGLTVQASAKAETKAGNATLYNAHKLDGKRKLNGSLKLNGGFYEL